MKAYRSASPVGHFKMPKTAMGIQGLNEVIANLNAEIQAMETRTMSGLIRAVALLRRSMDEEAPKIPVDTGNLRASWFVVTSRGGTPIGGSPKFKEMRTVKVKKKGRKVEKREYKVDIEKLKKIHAEAVASTRAILEQRMKTGEEAIGFGFGAYYAAYVHEMMQAKFKREGAGAKFFQAHLRRKKAEMLAMIAKEAKIRETGYALGGTGRAIRGKLKREFD